MQTATFKPLSNRAAGSSGPRFTLPEDGFIQLVPIGAAPNVRHDGRRILQQVDAEAIESMRNRLISAGGELMIDFEHFSHDADKGTDAAAWVPLDAEHLQNRADGLYGKPRWSAEGESAVTGGKLRFISPEFPDDDALLRNVGGNVFRPLALTGAGLTNRPAFRSHSRPLTNSDKPDSKPNDMKHAALLASLLGLSETDLAALSEADLTAKVDALKSTLTNAAGYKAELDTMKNREVEAFLETHKAVIVNAEVRKHVREQFLSNRALAEALVAGMTAAAKNDGLTDEQRANAARQPLHNRANAEVKPGASDPVKQAKEAARAATIRNRANEIAARENIPFSAAWQRAEAETPAEA